MYQYRGKGILSPDNIDHIQQRAREGIRYWVELDSDAFYGRVWKRPGDMDHVAMVKNREAGIKCGWDDFLKWSDENLTIRYVCHDDCMGGPGEPRPYSHYGMVDKFMGFETDGERQKFILTFEKYVVSSEPFVTVF